MAAAGRDHLLKRRDRAVDRADGVDREHHRAGRLVLLPGQPGAQDAGVVDPEVEAAVLGDDRGGEGPAGGLVADIKRRALLSALDLGGRPRRGVAVDIGGPDRVAQAGELDRDRAPEPSARPGYDRGPHPRHHIPPRLADRRRWSYHRGAGRADRGGRENPSRKVRTPKGRAVGNAHPGKPAGKCHRNTQPMARPHVSRVQATVKWCGKSAPASR